MPTPFELGFNDADDRAHEVLRRSGNQNRTVDKMENEALQKTTEVLGKIEYHAGMLRYFKEAQLPIANALTAKVAKQLREMADRLEAAI